MLGMIRIVEDPINMEMKPNFWLHKKSKPCVEQPKDGEQIRNNSIIMSFNSPVVVILSTTGKNSNHKC